MRRLLALLLPLSLLLLSGVYGASIHIEEEGEVLNYYDMYYVVDVEGEITITNTEDFSINTIKLHITPGTLAISELSDTGFLFNDGVRIPYLDQGASQTIRYRIYGVTPENVVRYYESDGESVLRHLMDDDMLRYRSDLWINLQKSEIVEAGDLRSRNLRIGITNPRPLDYEVRSIKVHRTDDADVNNPDKIWTFDDNVRIHGGDTWSRNFRDQSESMREDSVYWLIVDHKLARVLADITEDNDLNVYDESELEDVPAPDPEDPDYAEVDKEFRERTLVFLRKLIEPSTVYPGDVINVSIFVTNLDVVPKTINVRDKVPEGFELEEIHTESSLVSSPDSEDMEWQVEVNRDSSRIIRYSVRFVDEESLGLSYFPEAEAIFDEGRVSSTRAPYIRRFIPQKMMYLQKNIIRLGGDRTEIRISVRNIGEADVSGLVLKDYIIEDAPFSDITQEHIGRGEWELPRLAKNEEWEVSYRTEYGRGISRVPQLMGIDDSKVLSTVIMDSRISHTIMAPSMSIIEIIGMALLIVFPFIFIRTYKKKVLQGKV